MAESPTKRVGKFTVVSTEESTSSPIYGPETASKADQQVGTTSTADSLDETFTIRSSQTKRRSSRARQEPKPLVTQVAEAPADYKLWSQVCIGTANTVVVTWLGTECAMEKREAEMLEPPIARILARMP